MELLKYGMSTENKISSELLSETNHAGYWNDAKYQRAKLIDQLTDYNDTFADLVISSDSLDSISSVDIIKALREATLKQVNLSY